MSIAEQLQRQHLAALTPYASARRSMSGDGIWLNANEAPFTPSNGVDGEALNRYPSFQSDALNGAYANYAGVKLEQVLSCRGSDEAIDLLIRSFCEPGSDSIMITTPTYGMYAISAQTHGARVIDVPLQAANDGGLQLNTAAMLDAVRNDENSVKLVFICNPSNPLGNQVNRDDLAAFIDAVGSRALVVVDEAYIEFVDNSSAATVASWLEKYPQLVVLRTLSKAFGMAAIRCGFALANSDIIDVLRKVIAPYPMPQPCLQAAARAVDTAGIKSMHTLVSDTKMLRDQFVAWVKTKAWALKVWPSTTNFVLISVSDAAQLVSDCAAKGVLIRNQSAQRGLNNTVRVSIGSATEMQKLMEVLP